MSVLGKGTGKAMSIPGGLAVGGMAALAVTMVLSAFLAWLIAIEKVRHYQIGYGVMVILLIASFLGARAAYGKIKRQRVLVSTLSGLIYFAILLFITAVFFGCKFSGVGETALMVLCGNMLSILLHKEGRTNQKLKRKNRAYC